MPLAANAQSRSKDTTGRADGELPRSGPCQPVTRRQSGVANMETLT